MTSIYETHNGRTVDLRIEKTMTLLMRGQWNEPYLDELFTMLVREFIDEAAPGLKVSEVGNQPDKCIGFLILSLFSIDYEIVHKESERWPGTFDYLPAAPYASRVGYPGREKEKWTQWVPGMTQDVASLVAMMQLCREIADEANNRPGNLRLVN